MSIHMCTNILVGDTVFWLEVQARRASVHRGGIEIVFHHLACLTLKLCDLCLYLLDMICSDSSNSLKSFVKICLGGVCLTQSHSFEMFCQSNTPIHDELIGAGSKLNSLQYILMMKDWLVVLALDDALCCVWFSAAPLLMHTFTWEAGCGECVVWWLSLGACFIFTSGHHSKSEV